MSARSAAVLLLAGGVLAGCGLGWSDKGATVEPAAAEPVVVDVDWKPPAYDAAGCHSREEWLAGGWDGATWDEWPIDIHRGDATGDGTDEVLVQLTCPAPTSTRADDVVVFDVSRGEPLLRGLLGGGLSFIGADVTAGDGRVTLTGPTRAGADAQCCPEHFGTVVYEWTGADFRVVSEEEVATTQPVVDGDLPDGTYTGILRAASDDQVLLDRVEWFTGPAAEQACREDRLTVTDMEYCSMYYVRDEDDLVVRLPVAADAAVSYLDDYTLDEIALPGAGALDGTWLVVDAGDPVVYTSVTVTGGEVTAISQVYTP